MRKSSIIIFILFSNFLTAQNSGPSITALNDNLVFSSSNGMWIENSNSKKMIKGSKYLFDTWQNKSKIIYSDKAYTMPNFNYNIKAERFEAKVSDDSVFIINPRGIKEIRIDNKCFVRCFDAEYGRNSYFESVIKLKDVQLLRKYVINIKYGTINPMTLKQITPDMYIKDEKFFVANLEGDSVKEIKLKKRAVLGFIEKDKLPQVKTFIEDNKLKYKNLDDVLRILKYSETI